MKDTRRVLRISNRLGTARPLRAHHHFERAGTWLVNASVQLGRAVDDLNMAMFFVAMAPQDVPGAAAAMFNIARHIVEVGVQLAEIGERLTTRSECVLEAARRAVDRRPRVPLSSRPMPRSFLIRRPDPAFINRMQRPPPRLPDDAPRRISRGRAPPCVRPACSQSQQSRTERKTSCLTMK